MKKTIATLSVALLLSGCAVLDSLKLAKFDTNEYGSVVDLRSYAQVVIPFCDEEYFDIYEFFLNETMLQLQIAMFGFSEKFEKETNGSINPDKIPNDELKKVDS